MVIVLLCLMVVGLTSAGLLRWITLHQRQVRQTQWTTTGVVAGGVWAEPRTATLGGGQRIFR